MFTLRPEHITEIERRLNQCGAGVKCPSCTGQMTVANDIAEPPIMLSEVRHSPTHTSSKALPMVYLTCGNCGRIVFYALGAFGLKLS